MKVHQVNNSIKFEGYKPIKSDYGRKEYEFSYVFDPHKYDCYLEIFSVDQDRYGNYLIKNILNNNETDSSQTPLNPEKITKVDLAGDFGICSDEAFAYRYKLVSKNNGNISYKIDSGNTIKEDTGFYNIVSGKAPTHTLGGAMKLIVPDFNNVAWVYDNKNNIVPNPNLDKAKKTVKNFSNKIGGSLAGIEKDVDDGKFDNFRRIITTPLFTDDSLTPHAYWNRNTLQMANSLGNINNYTSLQKKLFAKGINLVADGAFVNEGLEGVHFRHILKWGEASPYFYWFKIENLKNSPIKMGIFGKDTKNVTHKLINSKYNYIQKPDGTIKIKSNKHYKSNHPTYIQIYDKRLVENPEDEKLIKAYDKLPETNLDINTHNDTVVPYSFRINPETYNKNVIFLNEYNKKTTPDKKISMYSSLGTKILSNFEYFTIDGKHEGGFETWDANPDIAKLNYIDSHSETVMLKNILNKKDKEEQKEIFLKSHAEVQDYAISTAKYWTQKTNRILRLHVAQNLKNIDNKSPQEIFEIIKSKKGKVFPDNLDINQQIVNNVINNKYNLKEGETKEIFNNYVLQGLMDLPLDSVEVGSDITSVLASPYITKRAIREKDIGVSRFDFWSENNIHIDPKYAKVYEQTDSMYTKEMFDFAKLILSNIDQELPEDKKFYDKWGHTTSYGKYVLPILTSEIARFSIIKAVYPNAKFSFDDKTGEISYDYNYLKDNTSLLQMGIVGDCPEDEAKQLVKKLKSGISHLTNSESAKQDREDLMKALLKSIEGTSLKSFQLSEMIVNRAQAGLDWRIDATKDIADIEALRNGKMDFETVWNDIIKFWSKFGAEVKKYYPDAYIAAEVTDEDEIFDKGYGNKSERFSSSKEAVKKFLNETGFSTTANYTYLSSAINQIFGKLFDYDGHSTEKGLEHGTTVFNQLKSFLESGSLESLLYSYTFAGNHDKCRALEGYAIDTDLVYADLTEPQNSDYRKRAYKILHGMAWNDNPNEYAINHYDFRTVSNLAIAKCESISSGIGIALEQLDKDKQDFVYKLTLTALQNLANGNYKGKTFEADGFGAKDFNTALDIVFSEMEYINNGSFLTNSEMKMLKKNALEKIIDPAMSKLLGHIKYLVALTGCPTLYAGDEYGSTGFEYTTKNITVQNRNVTHEEWADDKNNPDYMEFVDRFKKHILNQFNLRKRPELEPLNDGAPFVLNPQTAVYDQNKRTSVSALLRQSPNGAMTLSVFNPTGLNHKYNEYYTPKEITLDSISFDFRDNNGLENGIKEGLKFVNAFDKNDVYYTREVNGNYFLKHHVNGHDEPIKFSDSTLILYNQPSFTGGKILYNQQYNIVSKHAYIQKDSPIIGSKLLINAN